MGVIQKDMFGFIRGKVGNKIYYVSKGKQLVRMAGKASHRSPKQLHSQQCMAVIVDFMKPILPFVQVGFGVEARLNQKVAYHLAVGFNRKQALKAVDHDISIDFEKVVLSVGNLPGLAEVNAVVGGDAETGYYLQFDWAVLPEDRDWPRCDDQVMLMAYLPGVGGNNMAYYKVAGARRSTGQDVLELPGLHGGVVAEVYMSVISEDRYMVSDSRYLGSLTV